MEAISARDLGLHVGKEVGVSQWLEINQPLIDAFADLTGDHQFIHVDPDRAAREGPFGTTVAHGLLTLSLLPELARTAVPRLNGVRASVNYGFDRVRFVSPVRSGARIRGRYTLKDVEARGIDAILTVWEVRVEIEGEDRPALIADWLGLRHLETATA